MPAAAVEAVRAHTDPQCHATNCSDSGCSLLMLGAPGPNILINMEHFKSRSPQANRTATICLSEAMMLTSALGSCRWN